MACEHPRRAFRTFESVRMFKSTDKEYYSKDYKGLEIPCGTCILCREEQARQQAIRIAHEATGYAENSFVTLSYADKYLPRWGSLNYDDFHKFNDRARKRYDNYRYYGVGEYGTKSKRAHYHLAIFGKAFIEKRIITQTSPYLLWTSPELEALWGLGQVKVGVLNFRTANYTASYITKKLRSKQQYVRVDEETGELIPLEQPRAFMSRNLGKEWWYQWGEQTHVNDYVVLEGRRQKPPKAYDRWLKEKDNIVGPVLEEGANEKRLRKIKERRIEKAEKQDKAKTHARAEIARARASNAKNKL